MKQSIKKRWLAGFLACLTMVMTILTSYTPLTTYAANFTGRNIWAGGSEVIFGSDRSYLFRWSDGFQNTFCIEPGQSMNSRVRAGVGRYNIEDSDIPYISSQEDFRKLALICDWYEKKAGAIDATNASYAAAQVAVWAVVNGEWDSVSAMGAKVNSHVSGLSAKLSDLLNYVENAYPGINGLPNGIATSSTFATENPLNMTLDDGSYKLEIDISACPDLTQISWSMPSGFSQSVSGNTLTFTYSGSEEPVGIIEGKVPASMASIQKNSENLTIYIPENETKNQAMISAGLTPIVDKLYISVGGGKPTLPNTQGESPTVEVYRHKESFESNYLINLNKYCGETGQELQGSTFEVLEAFDSSQLGDGEDGSIAEKDMSPRPATWVGWKVCGQMLTDENGHAEHSDRKFYKYDKTYCSGHPEPEYLEVPEYESDEETGEDNQSEIDAVEAENERLRAEWEALVELCESETDFHSIEEGEAEDMMIEDRDATYDTFTNLIYQYTVREKTARPGYIIHGNHNDDISIETIVTDSSEAGANATIISTRYTLLETRISSSRINQGNLLAGSTEKWEPAKIESVIPELEPVSLTERREVIKEGMGSIATPSNAATPSNTEHKPSNVRKARTSKSAKIFAKTATSSNATMDEKTSFGEDDVLLYDNIYFDSMEERIELLEEISYLYQYILNSLHFERKLNKPTFATYSNAVSKEKDDKMGILNKLIPLFFGDDKNPPISVSVSLPEPELDNVADVTPGTSGNLSYTFEVKNHRTEGEIHINKRDMELYRENGEESYGQTQGDATLEGAVYGLFAATNIIHPDGKTGTVYNANDLVAIATTDIEGNASFMAFTEESDTSRNAINRDGTWIGHPLLLGSYYIKELSRSEGYELSVTGINLTESNRLGIPDGAYVQAGEVTVSGLSHRIDDQDGSWNDTTVSYYKTENGFDMIISGYPENSRIFEVTVTETDVTENVIIDSQLVSKMENGNPVYQTAVGGELKLDSSGNPIPLGGEDLSNPITETWYTYYRVGKYPSGTATPKIDPAKWADVTVIDEAYIQEEVNDMLSQLGYTMLDEIHGDGSPWVTIELNGTTNEELGTEILDWYAANDFWNCGVVNSIFDDSGVWKARIFYDYQGQNGASIYDSRNGVLYIKKSVDVSGGAASSHAWIPYPNNTFSLNGFYAIVSPKKQFEGTIPFGDDMEPYIVEKYQPLFDRYASGEVLRDLAGNPIPEMEWQYSYGPVTEVIREETLTPVSATYDPVTGNYVIHVDNVIDWNTVTEKQKITYRVQAPKTSIEVNGKTMDYSDYLVQVKGAGVTVLASRNVLNQGSYVKFQDLIYPGQVKVYQDGGTREEPVQVLQRVIKQSVKVTKDISQESYIKNNTYKIHRDPFTVLFGGYVGNGKKYIADFHFKLYPVSDLIDAGLLTTNDDGTYDYKSLFEDETKRNEFDQFAVAWDKPDKDLDGDLTTLHVSEGTGLEPYYGRSIMLPYGTYVIVEQIPRNLINKHYELDDPQEVTLPFVPQVDPDGTVHEDIPSNDYLYFSSYTPEELTEKFYIRFNEETHIIQAHNHDGDFEIYKYGLDPDILPNPYANSIIGERYHYGQSENSGTCDGVYYQQLFDQSGNVIDYGVTLDGVDTMTGKSTAINGKYAAALVSWSVLDPRTGEVINDEGDIGIRNPGLENGSFNFVAFAKQHFENKFYSSKLRVEKLDSQTGENIIHDGAIFKIYAASRDVTGSGTNKVTGTGQVLWETITVTGSRPELEARGDVDNITWDPKGMVYTGTVTQPIYDESEQIFMLNEVGNEVGIFKAFSTEHGVRKSDGSVVKEKTGYIETFQPLGAGVYVLVEQQPPIGYQKSKPIAFEIYKDEIAYYPEGDSSSRTVSDRYQYVVPMTSTNEIRYEDVAQVTVTDSPSKLYIHKVEDGDQSIGDINGLDHLQNVNDAGDLLTYIVKGRKEYLEARADVDNITWDAQNLEYWGTVTKPFDEWSESLIEGTEAQLIAMDNVKPLYDVNTGYFSGYGIRFDIYVREATMSLYEGLQIERTGTNAYSGVTVKREDGKVTSITSSLTGSHLEITTNERDTTPPYHAIWDTEEIANEAIELYFYDLDTVDTELDEITGELWILDSAGNRICYADSVSGMAYSKDDYGNLIAYRAIDGEKVLAQSIEVHNNGTQDHIYVNIITENDEHGFPLYYESGEVTYRPERWKTTGEAHEIERLPFGAYILEETEVPYNQGYAKAPDMGLILRESSEEQHFFYQNVFTKLNLAKVDVTTKEEIQDAGMTLYTAIRVPDDSDRGYYLEKDQVYTSWISGYLYDDNGNMVFDGVGDPIPTEEPYWIDHIPVGDYILEETIVPYDQGYVQSESIEIIVADTGNVQTGAMEDDYTGLEIRKYNTNTNEVLDNNHQAKLALYQAELDQEGKPLIKTTRDFPGREIPVYQESNKILDWLTEDGTDVAATGRLVTDEYGDTRMVYDYNRVPIPTTKKGYYYITETGSTMFHYLPVGYYVLVEEETPEGYATADPILVEITDVGHLEHIHLYEMPDVPLTVDIWKVNQSRGKIVKDAFLQVYKVDEFGTKEEPAVYSFYTGADGVFTEADEEAGVIPEGLAVGDLKPHRIEYIPLGDYVLVESITPYGFLRAADVYFTVMDTPAVQYIEMEDVIPDGLLEIVKRDSEEENWLLEKATFEYWNRTNNQLIETITTDEAGKATASDAQPIGYLGDDGKFKPYVYEVIEIDAPDSHMINRTPFPFQYQYANEYTPLINVTYDAINDINQVIVSKKELTSKEELPGAEMMVTGKYTRIIVDHWISTEQPHYIKGILPGWYVLTEITVPSPGYAKAESIEFEVTENMEVIPYLEMFDDHTKIEIEKRNGSSGMMLPGAKLQLESLSGEILYQWITTEEAYFIAGLKPGEYLVRELEAPAGFMIGNPVKIIVGNTTEVQTFTINNYKISTGGGGGTKPGKQYISFKKVDTGGMLLPGAEFTFYNPDKSILAVVTSGINGVVQIEKPKPGTYTFKETRSPEGVYPLNKTYSFTVTESGVVTGDFLIVNVPFTEIVVTKKDLKTDLPLQGAIIGAKNPNGQLCYEGITDENGNIRFTASMTGTFTLFEIQEPEGYTKTNSVYEITVNEDGSINGDLDIYNCKSKIGRIVLRYGNSIRGIPKTGDESNSLLYLFGLIFFLSAFLVVLFISIKEKRKMKKLLAITFILGSLGITSLQGNAYAAQESVTPVIVERQTDIADIDFPPAEISVNYELPEPSYKVFEDGSLSLEIRTGETGFSPDKKIEHDGVSYELKDYDVNLLLEKEPQIETIKQYVTFTGAEQGITIPDSISVPVIEKQGDSSKEYETILVLTDQKRVNERWVDDFAADMTIYDYDADQFLFGTTIINKATALEELKAYDNEVLEAINLDPGYYRIQGIRWDGLEYSQDSVICRNAIVYGDKLQHDIIATYETAITVNLPEEYICVANYELEVSEVNEEPVQPESEEATIWDRLITFLSNPLVSLGLFILIVLVVVIIYILAKRKKVKNRTPYIELRGEDEN